MGVTAHTGELHDEGRLHSSDGSGHDEGRLARYGGDPTLETEKREAEGEREVGEVQRRAWGVRGQ